MNPITFNRMNYRTDYHIYSTFSDGKAEPDEYIQDAIRAGMNEIGFSEHLKLFRGRERSMIPADFSELKN
jgi:histidinol phosphatase-like PHP family hydrolase